MQYTQGYLLDGRYELNRFIGSGTFGEVWVAVDKATDIEVAIKVYVSMDEKGLQEFKTEFQISFELNHTNLLHANYLGVNSEDKRPYLVMPYCPDGSVTKFAGNMTEEDLWRFVRDVAAGLAYLHSKQPPIIHQDIKPDNILILKNGDFVVTDFGISKQLRATLRKSALSLNSAGAISYMGPERFTKQYQAVKASDIWSLGVSIFELATGELPFCGMGGSLLKQGAEIPELPEEYSELLNMVCQSCMAKAPWERPTAAQLSDFANKVLNGDSPKPVWLPSAEGLAGPAVSSAPAAQVPAQEPATAAAQAATVASEPVSPAPATESGKNFNQTIAISDPHATQVVQHPVPEAPSYPPVQTPAQKVESMFGAGLWIGVALAGVAIGFLLNYFI